MRGRAREMKRLISKSVPSLQETDITFSWSTSTWAQTTSSPFTKVKLRVASQVASLGTLSPFWLQSLRTRTQSEKFGWNSSSRKRAESTLIWASFLATSHNSKRASCSSTWWGAARTRPHVSKTLYSTKDTHSLSTSLVAVKFSWALELTLPWVMVIHQIGTRSTTSIWRRTSIFTLLDPWATFFSTTTQTNRSRSLVLALQCRRQRIAPLTASPSMAIFLIRRWMASKESWQLTRMRLLMWTFTVQQTSLR